MTSLTLAVDNTPDLVRADVLQARESLLVEALAKELLDRVLWQDYATTDRRIQARARYLCTHAVRSLHDGWEREARRRAKDAVIQALKTECGRAFAGILTDAHYEALAVTLVSAALDTAKGVTEGSSPILPGDYLRITGHTK